MTICQCSAEKKAPSERSTSFVNAMHKFRTKPGWTQQPCQTRSGPCRGSKVVITGKTQPDKGPMKQIRTWPHWTQFFRQTLSCVSSILLAFTSKDINASALKALVFQGILSKIPSAGAVPIETGPPDDLHASLATAWEDALLVAPFVIVLLSIVRLLYIIYNHSRPLRHPIVSGALAMHAAFAWWVLRSLEPEAAAKKAIVLTVFVAFWTDFLADSCRMVEERTQYLLTIVFAGGAVNLLFTALSFISSTQAESSYGLAGYLRQTVDNGPFWYSFTAVMIYVLNRCRGPSDHLHATSHQRSSTIAQSPHTD